MEVWQGLSACVVGRIADDWQATDAAYKAERQEHYFSAEFLMGRALLNNLSNLGLVNETREALASFGIDLSEVLEQEPDAALGNGGLGRLAACFLDSCATLELPVTGYGILYRYGLFKQLFDNGFQTEHPDPWMEEGYPFVIRREEQQRIVRYADMWVRAIPHDMPITGYGTRNVGTLRLWKAEPMEQFDYQAFNSQRFTDAIVERERTSDISRVLYPNDTTFEGKVLRVRQQYFFCSASLQEIVDNYIEHHGEDLTGFAKYNSIQLNDTHPVLSIPELMRILLDEHGMGWDEAWEVVTHTFAYTNHTVLAEALEKWEMQIFDRLFPRISEIVREIDRRFREDMNKRGVDGQTIEYMAPVSGNQVRMAWIACYASYSINGVAALHTEIIKRETLKEWHAIWPQRFNNKTNGVTPRRWLNQCNPRLASLLSEVTGSDTWVKDLSVLANYTDSVDESVYDRINEIKHANKVDFAAWVSVRASRLIRTLFLTSKSSDCTSTSVNCSTPSTCLTSTSASKTTRASTFRSGFSSLALRPLPATSVLRRSSNSSTRWLVWSITTRTSTVGSRSSLFTTTTSPRPSTSFRPLTSPSRFRWPARRPQVLRI